MRANFIGIFGCVLLCLWGFPTVTAASGSENEIAISTAGAPVVKLQNTTWRIDRLAGEAVPQVNSEVTPQLVIQAGARRTFYATVGCNRLSGSYILEHGKILRFRPGSSTRMACPQPLDRMEAQLAQMLAEIEAYKITGDTLDLMDAAGAVRINLTSVDF